MRMSPDVRIQDIDPVHWRRLVELIKLGRPVKPPMRRLLVYVEDGVVRKVLDSAAGAVSAAGVNLRDLEVTRVHYGVQRVTVLKLEDVQRMQAVQSKIHPLHDFFGQALALVNGIGGEVNRLTTHPKRRSLPLVPAPIVQLAADFLVTTNSAAAFFVLDGDRLWTSLICYRGSRAIELLTTYRYLEEQGNQAWEIQPQALREAMEKTFGAVGSCLVMPKAVIEKFNRGELDRRGFWKLVATREVVWDPCPVPGLLRV